MPARMYGTAGSERWIQPDEGCPSADGVRLARTLAPCRPWALPPSSLRGERPRKNRGLSRPSGTQGRGPSGGLEASARRSPPLEGQSSMDAQGSVASRSPHSRALRRIEKLPPRRRLGALEVPAQPRSCWAAALLPSCEILSRSNVQLFLARIYEPVRGHWARGESRKASPTRTPRTRTSRAQRAPPPDRMEIVARLLQGPCRHLVCSGGRCLQPAGPTRRGGTTLGEGHTPFLRAPPCRPRPSETETPRLPQSSCHGPPQVACAVGLPPKQGPCADVPHASEGALRRLDFSNPAHASHALLATQTDTAGNGPGQSNLR